MCVVTAETGSYNAGFAMDLGDALGDVILYDSWPNKIDIPLGMGVACSQFLKNGKQLQKSEPIQQFFSTQN